MTETEQMLMELLTSHKIMKASLDKHIADEDSITAVVAKLRKDVIAMKELHAVNQAKLKLSGRIGLIFLVPVWAAIITFIADHFHK